VKISVGIYPNERPADIIESAKLADEMCFSTLWVLDSHLLFHEVYTLLGALAVSTRRIRLGTAVTNPLTRHPTVTASAFLTLAELSGGRATLGISVGDSALKSMNFEVAKMSTLGETVALCRKLLRGEAVSFGESQTAQLHRVGPAVPIYVAATGPKMLDLAGRIADGVILMNGVAPELIREAVRIVREGERAAAREQEGAKIAVWAACHPTYDAVKFNVARAILRNIPGPIDDLTWKVAAQVKQAYDYQQHGDAQADFARLIPDEIVARFAFSGEPSAIARQIKALEACGVDEVVLAIPVAPKITPRDAVVRELGPIVLSDEHREVVKHERKETIGRWRP
jgi:5,10-methylenetetrahydromethanopterin reductase